jgi:SAM-dependent methyltransferase
MSMFEDLTDVYEAMIDWPKRLSHEEPFYRRLFAEHGVHRVVDTACGTGRHAAMFHSWGLSVEGADVSPGMIDRARANFGEPAGLHWVVRGFDEPIAPADPFDAALCVGNSLPLAPDTATAERAMTQMLAAVRDGGLLVVQALNFWRLPEGPCIWQKCRPATLKDREVLIIKGVHRCAGCGYVELLVAEAAGGALLRTDCVRFFGLEPAALESMARAAGASEVRFFGGYREEPYERQKSADLLMVATKPG